MDSLGLMVMSETLLTTRAFDQQGSWPIKLLIHQFVMQNNAFIPRLTLCDSNSYSICYANINIFMYSVSGR